MCNFNAVNERFGYLFNARPTNEDVGESGSEEFARSFGWLYNCKMVSEFESVSIDDAWKLPVIRFLNDLSYLKMKREIDNEQERKILKKYTK